MTQRLDKYKLIALALAALVGLACDRTPPDVRKSTPRRATVPAKQQTAPSMRSEHGQQCPGRIEFESTGTVSGEGLTEISGIVASRSTPGIYWVHNDSGDGPQVYAITAIGRHVGTLNLPVEAVDWEDIAVAKTTSGATVLYVADFGDNFRRRKGGVLLHRFEEPDLGVVTRSFPEPVEIESVETAHLKYPGGPIDAEALLVDAKTGEIVLLTKPRMAPPQVMSLSGWAAQATMKLQGTITEQSAGHELHLVTGADLSPDGRWIAVRTYNEIFLFRRGPAQSMAEALLGRACLIRPAREAQGESIGFSPSAASNRKAESVPPFVTVSEGVEPDLFLYRSQ